MNFSTPSVPSLRTVISLLGVRFLIVILLAGSSTPLLANTLDIRVSSSSDDAEERPRNSVSYVALTSSDLEMTLDRSIRQNVGIRFTGLNIPQGNFIERAYIQFTADELNSEPTELSIGLHSTLYASTFREDERLVNGDRPVVSTKVRWSPPPWTVKYAAGVEQQTPDLSQMIQELVDRERYGNTAPINLAFIITGTGERTAVSFDKSPDRAALLHIEYSDQPVNQAPFVDAGFDSSIELPYDTVPLNASEVIDDGLPNGTLSYSWEVTASSAGGAVSFEPNANVLSPRAVFSAAGNYVLRLTASDGALIDTQATQLSIQGENSASPATFGAAQYGISNRPVTSASVNWAPVGWSAVGKRSQYQRTPDISSIVQEIVDRGDWQNGNSMAIIITGTGRRTAESFDGTAASAPLLHVQFK